MTPVPALDLTRSQMQEAGSVLLLVSSVTHASRIVSLRVVVGRSKLLLLGDSDLAIGVQVVALERETILVTVEVGDDGVLDGAERGLLHEHLSAHARVDARGGDVLVAAAVDVSSSEAHRRATAVDVGPVVVVVGDVKGASVLVAVAVRVADQAGLPVIGELGPADGDEVGGALDIEETVVEVLVTGDALGGEVTVVDPDIGGALNVDEVLALRGVVHLEVADDDVLDCLEAEATTSETYEC